MFSRRTSEKNTAGIRAERHTRISSSYFNHFQSQMCHLAPSITASIELMQLFIERGNERVGTQMHEHQRRHNVKMNVKMKHRTCQRSWCFITHMNDHPNNTHSDCAACFSVWTHTHWPQSPHACSFCITFSQQLIQSARRATCFPTSRKCSQVSNWQKTQWVNCTNDIYHIRQKKAEACSV